jgi:hypothetical protein
MSRPAALAAVAATLAFGVTGCGAKQRSASTFCSVVRKYSDRFQSLGRQMNEQNAAGNPFGTLLIAFGSLGEVERFLGDLENASPDEIEGDVAVAHDDMRYAVDHIGSSATSLGGFFDVVGRSLVHQNSYRRVDAYAASNCRTPLFAPPTTTSG